MFLYVIGFLGEFDLSPLEIPFALRKHLHTGCVGGVWGRIIEGICVERVGGAEGVFGVAGWGID